MSIPIEKVNTGNFTMKYFRFGTGEKVLVILPGLSVKSVTESAESVAAEYSLMKNDFTVYVFDRREELPPFYSVSEMAEDTAEVFRALGLSEICLFGASQGGMIAMEIAIEHPGLVHKLILGSTSADVRAEQYSVIEKWIALAKKKDKTGLYLDFGEKLYPPEIFKQYRDALICFGQALTDEELERFIILAEGTKGFCAADKLDGLQCPVLAIGSYDDAVLGADSTLGIAQKLKNKTDFQIYMYNGYGHAAFDTAPDYRKRLLNFFMQ